jgi:hypothetical protein
MRPPPRDAIQHEYDRALGRNEPVQRCSERGQCVCFERDQNHILLPQRCGVIRCRFRLAANLAATGLEYEPMRADRIELHAASDYRNFS